MPLPSLGFQNPLLIAEEGERGKDYRALIISGDEASATSIHEQVPAQIWDSEDGYSEVQPVWRMLKFGQWSLFTTPREWNEPNAHT